MKIIPSRATERAYNRWTRVAAVLDVVADDVAESYRLRGRWDAHPSSVRHAVRGQIVQISLFIR